MEALKDNSFSKYTSSEKHEILCLFRKFGDRFVDEIDDILIKNDANNLRKLFCSK